MIFPVITTYSNGDAQADAWATIGLEFEDPERGTIRVFQLVSNRTEKAVAMATYEGTQLTRKGEVPDAPEAVHYARFFEHCDRYARTGTVFMDGEPLPPNCKVVNKETGEIQTVMVEGHRLGSVIDAVKFLRNSTRLSLAEAAERIRSFPILSK